jgi:3-phosphoshikimate 1-carboxyvinyltransferase
MHPAKKVKGTFALPSSKSISNRLLILDALFPGKLDLHNLSNADDTLILKEALQLRSGTIDVKNAGTCLRFLTAFYASVPSDIVIHGSPRLHQRPIAALVNALRNIGAEIDYIDREGFAPLRIKGKKLRGGKISIDASESSQFVTALMLIAPSLTEGLTITLGQSVTSASYINMTEKLLYDAGIHSYIKDQTFDIPPQIPRRTKWLIEADWSAASYWYAIAALAESAEIILPGLTNSYLQGDLVIASYMERFGVHTEFRDDQVILTKQDQLLSEAIYDLQNEPDLVPAMSVALAGLGVHVAFNGIGSLKLKESDRIQALTQELSTCGFQVNISEDGFEIENNQPDGQTRPVIETYNDHRIAMAFATLALKFPEIIILDPGVVKKSYPGFWQELQKAGFQLTETD